MKDKKKCVILGAGGHARVIIDCVNKLNEIEILALTDPDESLWEKYLYDIPIIGDDTVLPNLKSRGADYFIVGVGSTRNNQIRKELFELGLLSGLLPLTIIHPSAIISSFSKIGSGTQIMAGAIINSGTIIGDNVIVNSGAIVEHDCVIGNHVHIATGATLSGTIKVGNMAHIGTGASIRQSINIGVRAVIGAGAVIVKDVPANTTYVGNPARPIHNS